jgi:hypothetical protein
MNQKVYGWALRQVQKHQLRSKPTLNDQNDLKLHILVSWGTKNSIEQKVFGGKCSLVDDHFLNFFKVFSKFTSIFYVIFAIDGNFSIFPNFSL